MDRTHLNAFLDQRVRDGVIRRALGKWMQAGVMEEGVISYPERGSPQGGVMSPLVSNIYLHAVLDQWFMHEVKPRLRGQAMMVRVADDALRAFAQEEDARRVLEVLAQALRALRADAPPREDATDGLSQSSTDRRAGRLPA